MQRTIRSGVVSSDIEVKFAVDDVVQVQVCGQDAFLAPQRARERLAERTDDNAAPADHDVGRRPMGVIRYGVAIGIVLFFGVLASTENEASTFDSDVMNGVLPSRM